MARKKPCEVISALRPAEPGPAAIRGAALAACRIGTVPSGWLSDRSQDTTMFEGPCRVGWLVADSPYEMMVSWFSGGRKDVSSACGLARSPSGHFASAMDRCPT